MNNYHTGHKNIIPMKSLGPMVEIDFESQAWKFLENFSPWKFTIFTFVGKNTYSLPPR